MREGTLTTRSRRRSAAALARAILGRVLLVVAGVTVALGALELVARWRFGRPLPLDGAWLDLTKLGFRYGTYRIEKDPLSVRVVGIGDSFAFGVVQPSYNYHHLLERDLGQRLGRPVEVINLGWPASGPAKQLALLRGLGLRFDPDVVVWMFFVGNDFTDDPPGTEYKLEEVLRRRHWEKLAAKHVRLGWYERLRLTGYIRFLALHLRHVGLPGKSRIGADTFGPQAFLKLEAQRMAMVLNDRGIRLAFRRAVEPVLKEAAGLCVDRQTAFVLAIAPDQAMVESALARNVLDFLWESGRLEPSDRQRYEECRGTGDLRPLTVAPDLLTTLGTMEGVWIVDLCEKFRETGKDGALYLQRDTHWSRVGNELAASLLTDTLRGLLRQKGGDSRRAVNHGESKSNSPATLDGGDSNPPVPRTVTR